MRWVGEGSAVVAIHGPFACAGAGSNVELGRECVARFGYWVLTGRSRAVCMTCLSPRWLPFACGWCRAIGVEQFPAQFWQRRGGHSGYGEKIPRAEGKRAAAMLQPADLCGARDNFSRLQSPLREFIGLSYVGRRTLIKLATQDQGAREARSRARENRE
jgi:hypothetical protein